MLLKKFFFTILLNISLAGETVNDVTDDRNTSIVGNSNVMVESLESTVSILNINFNQI
jgi:hypothetical protein